MSSVFPRPILAVGRELAQKVLEVVDAGLTWGAGHPTPGQMCVEAAVNYAMGAPHGDQPKCVAPGLRRLKIRLNDSPWSNERERARGLRRLAVAQLGSEGALNETKFAAALGKLIASKYVPMALRAIAKEEMSPTHRQRVNVAKKLEQIAKRCETNPIARNVSAANDFVETHFHSGLGVSLSYAVDAMNRKRPGGPAAQRPGGPAAQRPGGPASAAAAVVCVGDILDDEARDALFAEFAEEVVQILVTLKAPGCEWLDLAPLAA